MPEKHVVPVELTEEEMDFLGIKNLSEKEQGEKIREGVLEAWGWDALPGLEEGEEEGA